MSIPIDCCENSYELGPMEGQTTGRQLENTRAKNCCRTLLILFLGLRISLSAQDLPDKSAPNDRNTDLQFDFAVTNTGKLGTYRVVRLDTGETLALGHVGRDISPRATLLNEVKAAGVPARTPVIIQVQSADGSWSTVDRIQVHYPPEPSDSQRYLDDAGYRGNFQVPDLEAQKPTPTASPAPKPSPTATASPTPSPSPHSSPPAQGTGPSDKKGD